MNLLRTKIVIWVVSSFDKITMRMINDLLHTSKRLRVLSLSDHQNIKLLPDFVGNLKHLRYLNLSSTKIEHLPDSMCTL